MVVAVYTIVLHIPGCHSLKEKRRILLRLRDHVNAHFNVSMSEVGDQDLWQKATLGIACIANEQRHANRVMDHVMNVIEGTPSVQVVDCRKEFL